MRMLDRKCLRDLWHIKEQALAICLVMASGVATFVMSLSTLESLQWTQASFYDDSRFADVFAFLKRAPLSIARRVGEIPGVQDVEPRIVVDVTLDIPGLSEPAIGRLVSLPTRRPMFLNRVYLRRGRFPDAFHAQEVLVHEAFAVANRLQPGDELNAVIRGKHQHLRIVGIGLSPEYVYPIRPGEMIPDNRHFGILWMDERALSSANDMYGAFNSLSVSLTPGASEGEVIRRIDQLTERFGGLGAHGRKEQISHRFMDGEMQQLRGMSILPPTIFLLVTGFLLHIVLSRLIATQREQIATLKAFGYPHRRIAAHYLKFLAVLLVGGWVIGILVGAWFGHSMTRLYTRFFRFPEFNYSLSVRTTLVACAATGFASLLGVVSALRRALRLPPAEAMRPESPTAYRVWPWEKWKWFARLSTIMRMVARSLERQPVKSTMTVIGIAMATGVLILGNCAQDAIEDVLDFQFRKVQKQNLSVSFFEPAVEDALYSLQRQPGVRSLEPFRGVAIRARFGHRSRRLTLLGLPQTQRLFRPHDASGEPMRLPAEGVVMSVNLAEILHCRIGDRVTVEVLEAERPVREIEIVGLIEDFTDPACYMEIGSLRRLMREGPVISGAFVSAEPDELDQLYRKLKQMPRVAGVAVKQFMERNFRESIAENILIMKTFVVIFASIIAFGVVYNAARIFLAERGRDLATLRVLGFTRREVSGVLTTELMVLTALSIPLGLLCGWGFAKLLYYALQTETQRFPLSISLQTYTFSIVTTVLAVLFSAYVVRRRVAQLALISVLKVRE